MKTLVIGANGQIGRMVCAKARERGLDVRAMVRSSEQAARFEQEQIESVIGDLEGDFGHALDGCEQVVFTAGSGPHTGPDKTLMVDLYGAMRTTDEARKRKLRRVIMVSALRVSNLMDAPEKLRPYLVAKLAADHYLHTSGVPSLILRPGRLTDEPSTHRIRTLLGDGPNTISRENVAEVIVEALPRIDLVGSVIDLLDGDRPISEVLAAG